MNPLLIPELRELIQEKRDQELRDFLERLHPAQAAEMVEGLKPEEISWTLEIMHDDKEALIFEYLPEELQYDLAIGAGRPQLAKLVAALTPDDRAEFARQLPSKIVDEILPLMAQAARNDIKRLLSFEAGSAGARMNSAYASVPLNLSCGEALARVQHEAPDKETIYTIYITDEDRHLEGVVGLKDLLLSKPETPLKKVMRTEVVTIRAAESEVKAADLTAKYDLLAIPVLDDAGRLLGIVTVDDLIDVLEREATADIQKIGGSEALDEPYMQISFAHMIKKRAGWLIVLFLGEMLTATAMGFFEKEIERAVVLALFVPLIISSGGNSGSQASTLVIRALALGEVTLRDWWMVMRRELFSGLALGSILGTIGFLRITVWSAFSDIYGEHWMLVALTVGVALVGIVLWGTLAGSMLPFVLRRLGFDPAASSAPFVATLVDVTGLIIYFGVATMILQGTLL